MILKKISFYQKPNHIGDNKLIKIQRAFVDNGFGLDVDSRRRERC